MNAKSLVSPLIVVGALGVELLTWSGKTTTRGGDTLPLLVIPSVTVVVYLVLLLRWRRPLTLFAVQWLYSLAGLLVPGYQPVAGLLVALHAVASRARSRHAIPALVLCAVPLAVDAWHGAATWTNTETSFALSFTIQFFLYAVLTATIWSLGRLSFVAEERNARALREQAAEGARAIEAERLRLARDLHDIVTSSITAMLLQAAGARTLLPDREDRVAQALTAIEGVGMQAMRELHRLLGLLRADAPPDRTDAEQPGLREAGLLVELVRASGATVTTSVEGSPRDLDPSIDLAAYRVIQEALTNVVKHGGPQASSCIGLQWRPDRLTVMIDSADGPGSTGNVTPPALSSGYGLRGLAERVSLVGGTLAGGPQPGGYRVRAELPVSGGPAPSTRPAAWAGQATP